MSTSLQNHVVFSSVLTHTYPSLYQYLAPFSRSQEKYSTLLTPRSILMTELSVSRGSLRPSSSKERGSGLEP